MLRVLNMHRAKPGTPASIPIKMDPWLWDVKSQSKSLLFLECRKQVPQADTDQRKCKSLIATNFVQRGCG